MNSLLQKLTHSVRWNDFMAVGRGLYRVAEGATTSQRVRASSWMEEAAAE